VRKAVFDHHKPRHHARLGASRCEPCEYALPLTAGARRRGRGPVFAVEGGGTRRRRRHLERLSAYTARATLPVLGGTRNLLRAEALCLVAVAGKERKEARLKLRRPVAFPSALGSCR
jgi:hypothetical protein